MFSKIKTTETRVITLTSFLNTACYQTKPCNWFCPVGFCKSGTETKKLPFRRIVSVWTFLFHEYLAKLDWTKRLAFWNLHHIFTYHQSILSRLMKWGNKIFRVNPLWISTNTWDLSLENWHRWVQYEVHYNEGYNLNS